MISIRPFEREDLAAVIDLHRECFPGLRPRSPDEVDRKYRQLFAETPFQDPRLPALVACDEEGNVVGIWLALIRWWRLGDERIPARTGTARAVRPALQGQGIYRQLGDAWKKLRMAAHGDRSLGFSDRLTPVMVARDRKHPENVTILDDYGFSWVIPLRRRAARIRELEAAFLRRGAARAGLRRFARAAGNALERSVTDPLPELPETTPVREAPLTAQGLHESICAVGEAYGLRMDEDADALQWLLDYMRDYPSRGDFHGRLLYAEDGTPLGCYAGYLRPGKDFEVLALAARPETRFAVLVHLLKDAYARGCVTATGWASAVGLAAPLRCGARVRADSPASLTARDEEIKGLFLSHDVLITGLEGERWI